MVQIKRFFLLAFGHELFQTVHRSETLVSCDAEYAL